MKAAQDETKDIFSSVNRLGTRWQRRIRAGHETCGVTGRSAGAAATSTA